MDSVFSALITKEMAYLAAAAITIMLFLGKVPIGDKKLQQTKFWKEYGVFVLLFVCLGGSFVPGIKPNGEIGFVIIFGLLSAFAAHIGRKLLKPMFLNKLEGKK